MDSYSKVISRIALVILAFAFLLFTIYFLWTVYHATRGVTTSDIESVEKSLKKVDSALQSEDAETLKSFQGSRDDLQTNLDLMSKQTNPADPARKDALDNLNKVVSSLSRLQTQLNNQREERQAAIKDALLKLETIRKGIEPTATPEKIVGMAITRTFSLLIQLAWPLVILSVFLYLFTSKGAPERLTDLFSNFKSVELFSAKFETGEKIKLSAEEKFESFRKQAKSSFDLWAQRKGLGGKVTALLNDPNDGLLKKINEIRQSKGLHALQDYRCTIHVPDLLFAETFYQLLDYVPHQRGPETKGRTWSIRFGFIGKLWRSENSSDVWEQVPTDPQELINNWGMTKEEADDAGKDRQSFLGVMLVNNGVKVGLVYLDAKEKNAFGIDKEAARVLITTKSDALGITKDLSDIAEQLSGGAALIRIYSQR
jgi:uncharacterized protein YoxC